MFAIVRFYIVKIAFYEFSAINNGFANAYFIG